MARPSCARWPPADGSTDEQAILDLCSELQLELIALAGFYRTVSSFANGLRLPLEPQATRFPS
ncbi:hypothetical protein OOT46_00955 [Aquabacterium sp. A7-Y]|uniref:hypothetical protein n=1 Tax=Aquabacterium sp. A7-Y TaxID=1349605 RepID=UPI00223DC028|nr:hypothetical protein [Aquabacterium sp. A7-Y]MCW7536423.1 hypothetical protein [Aquabacterium sp. A7-Y]